MRRMEEKKRLGVCGELRGNDGTEKTNRRKDADDNVETKCDDYKKEKRKTAVGGHNERVMSMGNSADPQRCKRDLQCEKHLRKKF